MPLKEKLLVDPLAVSGRWTPAYCLSVLLDLSCMMMIPFSLLSREMLFVSLYRSSQRQLSLEVVILRMCILESDKNILFK